jgi:hypothetical protein
MLHEHALAGHLISWMKIGCWSCCVGKQLCGTHRQQQHRAGRFRDHSRGTPATRGTRRAGSARADAAAGPAGHRGRGGQPACRGRRKHQVRPWTGAPAGVAGQQGRLSAAEVACLQRGGVLPAKRHCPAACTIPGSSLARAAPVDPGCLPASSCWPRCVWRPLRMAMTACKCMRFTFICVLLAIQPPHGAASGTAVHGPISPTATRARRAQLHDGVPRGAAHGRHHGAGHGRAAARACARGGAQAARHRRVCHILRVRRLYLSRRMSTFGPLLPSVRVAAATAVCTGRVRQAHRARRLPELRFGPGAPHTAESSGSAAGPRGVGGRLWQALGVQEGDSQGGAGTVRRCQ